MRALQIAATGMSAQQTRVEVISNNLANMSTTTKSASTAAMRSLTGARPPAARERRPASAKTAFFGSLVQIGFLG